MDKIDKFLSKLAKSTSERVTTVIVHILSGNTAGYDVKKLKGYRDVYRIRIGTMRIIYRHGTDDVKLLDIGRRNEKTIRISNLL